MHRDRRAVLHIKNHDRDINDRFKRERSSSVSKMDGQKAVVRLVRETNVTVIGFTVDPRGDPYRSEQEDRVTLYAATDRYAFGCVPVHSIP